MAIKSSKSNKNINVQDIEKITIENGILVTQF